MNKLEQIEQVKEIIESQEAFIKDTKELLGELKLLLTRLESQRIESMDAGGTVVYMPINQLPD